MLGRHPRPGMPELRLVLAVVLPVGSLAAEDQALKVTLAPLSLEERTRVWHAVQRPYRLSISYEVRVVRLDSEVFDRARPVRERSLGTATAGVAA